MLGRTPANVTAIKPLRDGVIADFKMAEHMLTYFIKKAHKRKKLVHPRIVIGVPSETTEVEKRAVLDSTYRAKASEVHLVEQAMVAALGAGLPITEPSGNMWWTSAAAPPTSRSSPYPGSSTRDPCARPGNQMDDAVAEYVKRKHGLLIGERTAERVKMEIGRRTGSINR